jgi:pyridoxal 5'-phosphate synthase pdxT subunit
LALQGDFREHLLAFQDLEIEGNLVKTASEISKVDALVIPGGESTTISKLAKSFGLLDLISERIASGMPAFGTCAGMILLSNSIVDPASSQDVFGGIDMQVRRNAFGRQTESFEADLDFQAIGEEPFRGVFIRAPWVEKFAPEVEILASIESGGIQRSVAVRQGSILATAFHPELTGDRRIHNYFLNEVCGK